MKKRTDLLHALDQEWKSVPGIAGAFYVVVNEDAETGACSWLIRQDAGGVFPEHEHPYVTEMILLQGEMTGPEGTFKTGSYQCIPPKTKHGPYRIGKDGMTGLLISEGPVW